jgi:protein-S-isoprenylcysteine O-methyltransferase Ste14
VNGKTLSLLATAVLIGALVTLIYRNELFGVGPVSIALQIVAILFMVWARLTFGMRSFHAGANTTEGALITHGPYAIVRNPIYAAAIAFTWVGVAVHFEPISALLGLVVAAGMLVRIFSEEKFLRPRYPDYASYEHRVKRLVPFVF